jgi:hypothetical protein
MEEYEVPEKPDSHKERIVGLIIAAIAVVLAIITASGHQLHNEEILTHVDAADQFSFYQAKKSRHAQLELSIDQIHLDYDRLSPSSQKEADKIVAGYEAEIKHLEEDGKEIKAKGDELIAESKRLAKKADVLDLGEIALQISVVLCSITILTEQFLFVRIGVCTAAIGLLTALWGVFLLQ